MISRHFVCLFGSMFSLHGSYDETTFFVFFFSAYLCPPFMCIRRKTFVFCVFTIHLWLFLLKSSQPTLISLPVSLFPFEETRREHINSGLRTFTKYIISYYKCFFEIFILVFVYCCCFINVSLEVEMNHPNISQYCDYDIKTL